MKPAYVIMAVADVPTPNMRQALGKRNADLTATYVWHKWILWAIRIMS